MLILGLDYETTSADTGTALVLEAGLVLWDVEHRRAVRQADFLVNPGVDIPDNVWDEITPIHGIWKDAVNAHGIDNRRSCEKVESYFERAEVVVAHNGAEYDYKVHQNWKQRVALVGKDVPWVDTRLDVPEPMIGSLITLCAKKGFLNPFPHQALSDALSMLKLLSEYDITQVIERAKQPNMYIEAQVSFDEKQLAKDRGYFAWYRNERFQAWVKKVKVCDYEKIQAESPFRVRQINYDPDRDGPTIKHAQMF
jgi:DNA polymerase-3 subunit epsilon